MHPDFRTAAHLFPANSVALRHKSAGCNNEINAPDLPCHMSASRLFRYAKKIYRRSPRFAYDATHRNSAGHTKQTGAASVFGLCNSSYLNAEGRKLYGFFYPP